MAEASIKNIFCYSLIVAASVSNVNSQIVSERCLNQNFHKSPVLGDHRGLAGSIEERAVSAIESIDAIGSSILSLRRSEGFNDSEVQDFTFNQNTQLLLTSNFPAHKTLNDWKLDVPA